MKKENHPSAVNISEQKKGTLHKLTTLKEEQRRKEGSRP
jgi:hypothetical protein